VPEIKDSDRYNNHSVQNVFNCDAASPEFRGPNGQKWGQDSSEKGSLLSNYFKWPLLIGPTLRSFNGQYSMTKWVNRNQNVKPFWVLLHEMTTVLELQRRAKLQFNHHHRHTLSYFFL